MPLNRHLSVRRPRRRSCLLKELPRCLQLEDDAEQRRRGNSDGIWTAVGWRGIRTFVDASRTWRLTNLGKRYFERNRGLPEVVLRIPCIFETQKTTGRIAHHLGWFPYELLDESLRTRLTHPGAE